MHRPGYRPATLIAAGDHLGRYDLSASNPGGRTRRIRGLQLGEPPGSITSASAVTADWPVNLGRTEAARYLRQTHGIPVQPATLANWFSRGDSGPPAFKAGRTPFYPRAALVEWASQRLEPGRRAMTRDLAALKSRLAGHAERLVVALLGEPTAKGKRPWRWGRRGSLSYDFERHRWHSFEAEQGGDLLDLIQFGNPGWDFCEALDWGRDWVDGPAAATGHRTPRHRARRDAVNTAGLALKLWCEAVPPPGTIVDTYASRAALASAGLTICASHSAEAFLKLPNPRTWEIGKSALGV